MRRTTSTKGREKLGTGRLERVHGGGGDGVSLQKLIQNRNVGFMFGKQNITLPVFTAGLGKLRFSNVLTALPMPGTSEEAL